MRPLWFTSLSCVCALLAVANAGPPPHKSKDKNLAKKVTCGGNTYNYHGLEGYGFVPSNAVDKYGDTMGGIGGALAIEQSSWHRKEDGTYEGIAWALPDRGWNTNGTLNVQARIQKLSLSFKPSREASVKKPSQPNLQIKHLDTVLLTGPDGTPTTGLDADVTGFIEFPGFPPLPGATYSGDGFGSEEGTSGRRITMDTEGLALGVGGSFWVSDEYGPYIYQFTREGKMIQAIQPPEAYLPRRNGSLSFSAASPPIYDPEKLPVPEDTESGRNNNQGFEALTLSPDGMELFVMIQSGLNQEGGPKKKNRKQARLLQYDISGCKPRYIHEYVVTLPTYPDRSEKDQEKSRIVASQSEIHMLPTGDFLILSRDSGSGHGQKESRSVYRQADIFAITNRTTDIKSEKYDAATGSIASDKGELKDGIEPAEYCEFIDYNLESELGKFGLHNGGEQDKMLLNEKWESLALVPVDERDCDKKGCGHGEGGLQEYFLISFSDNDYITQDGLSPQTTTAQLHSLLFVIHDMLTFSWHLGT
ncbi:conserved hypothetical protein [Histoplasma capsulatum G186AR]|uniref:Phytase-like domain-containing protein n=1 Tax=Ajellomyces capsulatus (strain G186AR / H82 / ATCC MYA-2454 / RMSCC 2432) TaxID=447093 RepID=C0NAX4_AJECG|nr:uncharacterized protein HCBG_00270 [Histoplasma capsulatum G186AR]EEH10815.1 conserved hypothetical protein [Histoplasma capsulatum G186AR]